MISAQYRADTEVVLGRYRLNCTGPVLCHYSHCIGPVSARYRIGTGPIPYKLYRASTGPLQSTLYRPCICPVPILYRADTVKRYRPCTKNASKTYRAGTGVRYRAGTAAGIGPLQGQYRNVSWVTIITSTSTRKHETPCRDFSQSGAIYWWTIQPNYIYLSITIIYQLLFYIYNERACTHLPRTPSCDFSQPNSMVVTCS